MSEGAERKYCMACQMERTITDEAKYIIGRSNGKIRQHWRCGSCVEKAKIRFHDQNKQKEST